MGEIAEVDWESQVKHPLSPSLSSYPFVIQIVLSLIEAIS